MTGHLCLKWNNHSSAFITSISNIQVQEKYCDATLACQGKFFPVHRLILSTCSEYFDEIFSRMKCQHPYIFFKDIEASEIQMLLNYIYQGEVDVLQEQLPSLIKCAEVLKIKGLAVPDDLPLNREPLLKRRSSSQFSSPPSKRRSDEKGKSVDGQDDEEEEASLNSEQETTNALLNLIPIRNIFEDEGSEKQIKEEVTEENIYNRSIPNLEPNTQLAIDENPISKEETEFGNDNAGCSYMGSDLSSASDTANVDEVSPIWTDFQQQVIDSFPSKQDRQVDRNLMYEGDKQFSNNNMDMTLSSNLQNADWKYKQHKNAKKTYHFCAYCPYKSYNKASVSLHTQFKHTKEKPFECAVCSTRFVTKLILNRHMQTHTGEKQFQCTQCPFRCIQKVHLQKHMLTHTGEKQIYQCPTCARNFSQVSSLNRHLSESKCSENANVSDSKYLESANLSS